MTYQLPEHIVAVTPHLICKCQRCGAEFRDPYDAFPGRAYCYTCGPEIARQRLRLHSYTVYLSNGTTANVEASNFDIAMEYACECAERLGVQFEDIESETDPSLART